MTFLHNDKVLVKLLADTGVLDTLTKHAQQVDTEAKIIATKLANILATQAVQSGQKNEPAVYVRDLVDLIAYLNFLLKTNQHAEDGKPIVIHQTAGGEATKEFLDSIDKNLYVQYQKDFWVHKAGLQSRLNELDIVANRTGNEVMKPLVKNLIVQANEGLGLKFESSQSLPPNPYDDEHSNGTNKKQTPSKMNDGKGDPNYKNVSLKDNGENEGDMEEDFSSIRNVLPFQSTSSISPYDMNLFVRTMHALLAKYPQLLAGPMLGQAEQFTSEMNKNYAGWQAFVRTISSQNPSGNAAQALEEVPYNRAGMPNSQLEQIFGNTPNAREAANRLVQMINLSQQALVSLQRSPQIINLLGKDVVDGQVRQAQSLVTSLNPLARA